METKTRILIVTDFNLHGSGYFSIVEGLAKELCEYVEIKILGLNYHADEHNYNFSVIPTHYEWVPQHITALQKVWQFDWLMIAQDIPKIIAIMKNLTKRDDYDKHTKTIGMFPVESDPLSVSWANDLTFLTTIRFTFTEFGMRTLSDIGVSAYKLPVCLDEFWYEDVPDIKHVIGEGINKYILTVADNQIRKNLPVAVDAFSMFCTRHPEQDIYYVLVTDTNSKDGWDFVYGRICERVGLDPSRLIFVQSDIKRSQLKKLYHHASCLILPSLAEGIGFPLYEAQACGCPVFVTEHTGGVEAIVNGDVIKFNNVSIYPWGNVNWYWPSVDDLYEKIKSVLIDNKYQHTYVKFPKWKEAASKMMVCLSIVEEKLNEQKSS